MSVPNEPPAAPSASREGAPKLKRTMGRFAGDKVTPIGQPVYFSVLPIELK